VYSEYTPGDGQRNCLKHVVSCENKFAKLVHLVGFIIKKEKERGPTLHAKSCGRQEGEGIP